MNSEKLIVVFFLGFNLGVLAGVLGCGLFAFVLWWRLRNKNRGGNTNHGGEQSETPVPRAP